MKRNKITYPIIKKIKPFFWKECGFCGREFRKENGYKIIDYTKFNPELFTSYCCNECANSVEEVYEKLVNPFYSKKLVNVIKK